MKKRILTVLIAILTVIPLVLITPKADTGSTKNGTGTSNYGSYTYQFSTIYENFSVDFPVYGGLGIPISTGSSFSLNYHFKDTYTGYVQFTLNSNTGVAYRLDQCYWGVEGGYFNSSYIPSLTNVTSSKQFRIYVYNATEFTFTIVSTNTNSFHPTSTQYSGFGVSNFGYGLTDVGDVPDIAADIDFYLPGMSSSLTNIDNNTVNIASDIATIKGYLDGLEGYTDQIEPLLNDLIFQSQLNQFDFPNYQHSALYWGYAQVRGTDTHPTLEFWRGLPVFYLLTSEVNSGDYTTARSIRVPGNSTICLYLSSNRLFDSSLFNTYTSANSDFTVTYDANYNTVYQNIYNVITVKNNLSITKYIEFEPTASMYILPYFLGSPANVPDEVKSLFGLEYDNTYTRLLQLIANGVVGTSYDTSQYEQYEQTIDGLNDNMRDSFNNSETSFQNNLNNILTPDQTSGGSNTIFEQFHFNAINGVFTGFLGQLFNAAPVLQYLLLFGLLLLVLGVFI